MRLVIRAHSLQHAPLSQTIVGEFDERGGTIGRSDSNTMALPDPERHVSRLQAEITFAGGAFSIRNAGSSNHIIVAGRPLHPGEAAKLGDGDRMTIGGYELQVEVVRSAASHAGGGKAVDARTVIGASAREARTHPPATRATVPAVHVLSPGADPFADLLNAPAAASATDPFADLLGPAAPPPIGPAAKPAASKPPAPAAAHVRLPDDFDPFASLAPEAAAPAPSHEPSLGDLVGDRRSSPGSIDALFGLGREAPGADPLDAFMAPAAANESSDPFAFLDTPPARPADKPGPALPDDVPELQAAWRPPPVRAAEPPVLVDEPSRVHVAPVPPPPPPQPQPPATPRSAADETATQVLWRAFCEGAQLTTLPNAQRLTPELMRMLGATLRQAVEGTVHLSTVRTTAKQELRVPVTTIQSKNNNPLKFAPDATAALAQLLQPPMRGFMAGPEAMQDAMADLLGHAVGTMAGTRAAMQGMLERFEPTRLERQLGRGGVLDSLLPMNRPARLWELYVQQYVRISEGAREDFQELFGKAFLAAYEEQADRIAAARRTPRR